MPDALRVAAMDCGTNSLRLLVTDVRGDQKRDVVREMRVVRLGQGVDETGRFHPDALERTLAVTREFGELATVLGAERVRFCATSAARDASNADELSDGVRSVLGIDLEVLSGEEEARASFLGATRSLAGPALVVDIGGGSTELVVGADGDVGWSHSFDVGSVRLTERFLRSDPASIDEVTALESYLDDVLTPRLSGLDPVSNLVGVAGTITTVAAHALELPSYDSSQIHGARISVDDVRTACLSLLRMSVADRRALPFMHPGRGVTFGARIGPIRAPNVTLSGVGTRRRRRGWWPGGPRVDPRRSGDRTPRRRRRCRPRRGAALTRRRRAGDVRCRRRGRPATARRRSWHPPGRARRRRWTLRGRRRCRRRRRRVT